jgi:hypothetical protein
MPIKNWQKACKTFQGLGEKSVEKFPPQVVYNARLFAGET